MATFPLTTADIPLTPPPTPAPSEGSETASVYDNMYEMLIEDLQMMRWSMPRQQFQNLVAHLVARGHTGLRPSLERLGRLASPTPATGSRDSLNVVHQATNIGNSPSR